MSGETILVIDDAEENRNFVVQYVLEPNDYIALTAADGKEGFEMAVKHEPDLILLDYNMPIMDGIDVLKALNSRGITIPVILMTFHNSEDLAVEVFRLGVKDYIAKPFYPEEMEQSIYNNLSEVRLLKEREAMTNRILQANIELKQRIEELNVLYGIGRSVSSLIPVNQLILRSVDAAVQLTHAGQGHLHLLQYDKLICRARRTYHNTSAESDDTLITDSISWHIIKSGNNLSLSEKRIRKAGIDGVVAGAYVPLLLGKRAIGVLGVESVMRDAPQFTQHDSALLNAISDYLAIAIANSRNFEALKQAQEQTKVKEKQLIETTVSTPNIQDIFEHPPSEDQPILSKRQEISVLIADISSQGNWSQTAEPQLIIDTLNNYLNLAGEIIRGWEGVINRFSGDSIIAVFNTPKLQTDHIHRAADAALALIKASQEVEAQYGHQLTYRVGIHVGIGIIGYIGKEEKASFTAIGPVIDLTKRIQEYAAPGQVLVSEHVIKRLGSLAKSRTIGEMKAKGNQKKLMIYELNLLEYPSGSIS